MRSRSRSVTARSPTGPSTPWLASPSTGCGMCSACGWAMAARAPRTGIRSSARSVTAASTTVSSSSATDSVVWSSLSPTSGRSRSCRRVCCTSSATPSATRSKQYWYELARDLRLVYTASTEQAARERFDEFAEKWGERYPAIIRLWETAWAEVVPCLTYSPQIRKVIYSTNAIESVHARLRRSVRARGHFPTEQAAMKCLHLAVRSLDPTGRGQQRWSTRWKPALNALRDHLRRPTHERCQKTVPNLVT